MSPPTSEGRAPATDRRDVATPWVGAAVAAAVLAIHASVILLVRGNGWDDGSITLAFARTFAESGRVAITPGSEEVEGFSSFAWFMLFAGAAKLGLSNFDVIIRAAQIAAAVCTASAALLFYAASRKYLAAPAAAVTATALFAGAPFLNESMNGMEMSLLTLIVLGIVNLLSAEPKGGLLGLFVLAFVASTVRFEAVGFLVFSGTAVWLFTDRKREGIAITGGGVCGFAVVSLLRAWQLGTLLPNTISAKRWPPYAEGGLRSHVVALAEPFLPLGLGALVVVVLLYRSRKHLAWARLSSVSIGAASVFAAAYFSIVVFFNAVIGQNWGYHGRMQLSAIPPVVLSVIAILHVARARWSTLQITTAAAGLLIGSMSVLQWGNIGIALAVPSRGQPAVTVTPDSFRLTGEAVDLIRAELGQNTISFMTPDVGGSSLCCPRLQIIDLGLLANSRLATAGYANFDAYLAATRPDVIEVHGVWARVSGMYDSPTFVSGYVPVVVTGNWMWVRADLSDRLMSETSTAVDPATLRYRGEPIDEAFIGSRSTVPIYLIPQRE